MPFSVLMSLYAKERPEFLRLSLDSIFNQTLMPDEVVLVEDGPLTDELNDVVEEYKMKYPPLFKSVKLLVNSGLGEALRQGLEHCSHDLVARMDTDDVSKPERFEKQVAYMESHGDIAACGAWIDEFIDSTDNVISCRKTVVTSDEINVFAKSRSPLNHPTVMFRKKCIEAVGSYQSFILFEDWYLWARLIKGGYKLANIPESLLWFRTSHDMFKRRGGWRYACNCAKLQYRFYKIGFISFPKAVTNAAMRGMVYVMPNFVRELLYKKFLRA